MGKSNSRATSWTVPWLGSRTSTSVLVVALCACGSSDPQAAVPAPPATPPAMTSPVLAASAGSNAAVRPAAVAGSPTATAPVAPPKPPEAPPSVAGGGAATGTGGADAMSGAGAAGAGQTAMPASGCDRPCLIAVLSGYLDALTKQDPATLKLASGIKYTENGVTQQIGEGLWQRASGLHMETRVDFADPVEGQVGCQMVIDAGGSPTILSMRLKVVEGEITEVESVSVAGGSLEAVDPIFNQVIDPAKRMSRDALLMMAQAYEKLLEGGSYSMSGAKFNAEMIRRENGNQTANAASLMMREQAGRGDIPSRYPVIDEEYGLVYGVYEFKDNGFVPQELFKIMDGEIRLLDVIISIQGGVSGWPTD
jgi:hypothetical protein